MLRLLGKREFNWQRDVVSIHFMLRTDTNRKTEWWTSSWSRDAYISKGTEQPTTTIIETLLIYVYADQSVRHPSTSSNLPPICDFEALEGGPSAMYNDSSSSYYYYYYYYHDYFSCFYHYHDRSTMIFCFLLYSLRGATHCLQGVKVMHGQQEKRERL